MEKKHLQHLYNRAAFGITPKKLNELAGQSRKKVIDNLFAGSRQYKPLKIDTSEIEKALRSKSKNFKALIKDSRKKVHEYNIAWFNRMLKNEAALRERMTLFWANHFACQDNNIIFIQQFNNSLRKNALGNFKTLVMKVSKEPSMLKYLNNKQNRKSHPNENFARELLELFTIGVGNYTEQDIKEAARAFTGWNFNAQGDFVIRKKQHDNGIKHFMGKTGNFNGDDIIDIVLNQKQTARFICTKIYRYFVNEHADARHIEEMTAVFYKDYDIENLMRFVFNADWFYDENNIGTKIKSPIDLLAGIYQTVPYHLENPKKIIALQRLLNQVLLYPPNVAGWKGGQNWIDSNTLMLRMKLPSILLNDAVIALEEKGEPEDTYDMYYKRIQKQKKRIRAQADWPVFDRTFKSVSENELPGILLNTPLLPGTKKLIANLNPDSKRDFAVQLMSLPEYQLC